MDSNNELKENDIKIRTCYYFDDIIEIEDFDLDNILIDEKSYEFFLVYNILFKSVFDSKPSRVRFDKIDELMRVCDRNKYLVLFGSK